MSEKTARRVALMAPRLDPRDGRLLKQRASLTDAGFVVGAFAPDPAPAPIMAGAVAARWGGAPGRWLARLPGPAGLWARHRLATIAMVRTVERFAPDVLLVSEPEALEAAARVRARTGARLIYDAHEYYEDERPGDAARGHWVARIHRRFADSLDGFVTVGPAIAALYAAHQPTFPPAVVVMNAAPAKAGAPPGARAPYDGRLHARAGLPADRRILLFHGALTPHRGLAGLVEAAEALPDGWSLVLLGGGPLAGELRAKAGPRVRFVDPVPFDELPGYLSGADLGAVLYEAGSANQTNALPNKLWEYAGAGVPILASSLAEMHALTAGRGFVDFLPPGAPPADVAAAVTAFAARPPADVAAARDSALAFAATHSWELESARLLQLVTTLAERRSASKYVARES